MTKILIVLFFCTILISCNKTYRVKEIHNNTNVFFIKNSGIKNSCARENFNKGLDYAQNENFITANKYFLVADSLEKNNKIIFNAIALNNYYQGNKEIAFKYLDSALKLDSTFSNTYNNYGLCLNMNNNFEAAIDKLKKGFKFAENDNKKASFYYNMAISFANLSLCDSSLRCIEEAITLETDKVISEKMKGFKIAIKEHCMNKTTANTVYKP